MALVKNIKGTLVDIESLGKLEETPDLDELIILQDAKIIYYGDTDGDIPRIGKHMLIAQDSVKMKEKILGNKKYEKVGKTFNLAIKCLQLNARTTLREFES